MHSMFCIHFDSFFSLLLVVVAVLFKVLAKVRQKKQSQRIKTSQEARTPAPRKRLPDWVRLRPIRKLMGSAWTTPNHQDRTPPCASHNISPARFAPVSRRFQQPSPP